MWGWGVRGSNPFSVLMPGHQSVGSPQHRNPHFAYNGQPRNKLLQSILNPGQVIESAYTNYLVETRDGRLLDGLIVNETSNSLTLRRPEAEDLTLLKAAIADVRASSVSLMPDGFEDGINPRQMADLIAYLQGANLQ